MPRADNPIRLREAREDELAALSDLCFRSKAVWGYDKEFMNSCRAELTLTTADLRNAHVQVAERDGAVIAVAQVSVSQRAASLDKLFVEPGELRSGAGRALFEWAMRTAREHNAHILVIEADPDATEFYRRMGAHDNGFAPSGSIAGRMLPRLTLTLERSTK